MIKGVRKNTVFVKLPRDKYFECAYFIIRAEEGKAKSDGDMVREANRIIESSELPTLKRASRRRGGKKWAWEPFAVGAILGILTTALVWLGTTVF